MCGTSVVCREYARLADRERHFPLTVGHQEHVISANYAECMCLECVPRFSEETCGAGGGSRTLTGLLSHADFLSDNGLRPRRLDYPFTLSRMIQGLGAASLVSTPSRLTSRKAWLGIAT